jgi:hypothetical protein
VTGVILSSGFARAGGGSAALPASGCALLGGASGSAQIKSPAKAEKVQRKKVERPHRKLRSVEYRAFSTAAIRVMITSSFSVAARLVGGDYASIDRAPLTLGILATYQRPRGSLCMQGHLAA